jgi:SOS-response transcriptional repressor LexA
MTLKENCDNCDDWIEYTYQNWLKNWIRTLPKNEYLSESAQNIVDRMKEAAENQRTEEAWNLMERLKRMSGTFYGASDNRDLSYHDQWAEIYMECALVAYKLGDLTEASKLLHESTGNFYGNHTLQKAVVYWFLGCIQWQLPAHFEEAVVSWERSIKIIKAAASDASKEEKCKQVAEEMRQAINAATLKGSPEPPPSRPSAARVTSEKKTAKPSNNYPPARLKFLPYFSGIPAGGPVVVDNHRDMIDIEALEINGQFYSIFGVRGEREVWMKPSSRYFLAKVTGNSMNIADPINIDNDDYVLLESTQSAGQRDIVAAVTFDVVGLETATLKRYRMENGRQVLRAESDVEELSKIVITMSGKDYIQGVVVAILKPQ